MSTLFINPRVLPKCVEWPITRVADCAPQFRQAMLGMYPRTRYVDDGGLMLNYGDVPVIMSTRDDAWIEVGNIRIDIGIGPFIVYLAAIPFACVHVHHAGGVAVEHRCLDPQLYEMLREVTVNFSVGSQKYVMVCGTMYASDVDQTCDADVNDIETLKKAGLVYT